MQWTPDKVTALIVVVGCFALRFTGIDSEVMAILATAAAWLFGRSYAEHKAKSAEPK